MVFGSRRVFPLSLCSVWLTQATSRVAVFPCRSPRSYGRNAPIAGESGLKGELAGTSPSTFTRTREHPARGCSVLLDTGQA